MATMVEKRVKHLNKLVKFRHRDQMRPRAQGHDRRFAIPGEVPSVSLPIDNTKGFTISLSMEGNDTLGDCGEAMACHGDQASTFRGGTGTESTFALDAIKQQYLTVSGGDNGLDESMVVDQIMKVGIGGDPNAIVIDTLDMDITNVPLTQFALYNGFWVYKAWSVPDEFLNGFTPGSTWTGAYNADPANGHYTLVLDVTSAGLYSDWTWGAYFLCDMAFIASTAPQCFVGFSARFFDPATGLDFRGRHITDQAALWVKCGGNAIPDSVISQFPPKSAPVPSPGPNPAPVPNPAPTGATVDVVIGDTTLTVTVPTGVTFSQSGTDSRKFAIGSVWTDLQAFLAAVESPEAAALELAALKLAAPAIEAKYPWASVIISAIETYLENIANPPASHPARR